MKISGLFWQISELFWQILGLFWNFLCGWRAGNSRQCFLLLLSSLATIGASLNICQKSPDICQKSPYICTDAGQAKPIDLIEKSLFRSSKNHCSVHWKFNKTTINPVTREEEEEEEVLLTAYTRGCRGACWGGVMKKLFRSRLFLIKLSLSLSLSLSSSVFFQNFFYPWPPGIIISSKGGA